MSKYLKVDYKNSILELTIDREDAGNALNNNLMKLMNEAFIKYRDESSIKLVIIRGSGEKFFVAGGDLKELSSVREEKETEEMALRGRTMLDQIRYFPVPVIACLNGYALGGGAELAMACDYRVACETAKFGFIHSTLGITTAWGGIIDLIESIGSSKALAILIEGKMMNAKDAQMIGIIEHVESNHEELERKINDLKYIYRSMSLDIIRGNKLITSKYKKELHKSLKHLELDSFKQSWMSQHHWDKVEQLLSK